MFDERHEGPDHRVVADAPGSNEAMPARVNADGARTLAVSDWRSPVARERRPPPPERDDPAPPPARQDEPAAEQKSAPPVADKPAAPDEKTENEPDGKAAKPKSRRRRILLTSAALALIVLAPAGYVYWDHASHFESTDDAFIAARQYAIAPKVSGYIVAVPVTDNQHVKAGDVIAQIDQRDYNVALAQAEAQVAAAHAQIGNIEAQIEAQQAQIAANQAQVDQAQAGLVFAQQQAARYQDLEKTGAGSVQNSQQYQSQLHQQQAGLASAQATLKLAQRQVDTLNAQRASADANITQAEAQLSQAKLNLSYTTVSAAEPGRVVNLTAAVGTFAQPGTALTMFVPDDIWVVANFKETQLDRMRPDQKAALEIDAYPERQLHGHVASVQPGSGPAFSLLPPENATGNYVKIVQRVPVKIVMDNPPTDVSLGPGMSVVPTVRVDPNPSLYERLKARFGWL
jgi:membrane fusion protein, multidrug efflux system